MQASNLLPLARLIFFVLPGLWPVAFAQPACIVEQEQKLQSVTGRFSFGTSSVALTLPYTLFRVDPSIVYMQVLGAPPNGASIDSGGQKVKIADGAALPLVPQRNKRLTFSVTDTNGRMLCEWVTNVATAKVDQPFVGEGFDPWDGLSPLLKNHYRRFRNAGDPIVLHVGGRLAKDGAQFTVDDIPATVLSRNGGQVIVTDPHPAAGIRTIESRGSSIRMPFVLLRVEVLSSKKSANAATLEISILGRERVDLPEPQHRYLSLSNLAPGRFEIACGRNYKFRVDPGPVHLDQRDDKLTASCRLKMAKPGPVSVDALLVEVEQTQPSPKLPRWPRIGPRPSVSSTSTASAAPTADGTVAKLRESLATIPGSGISHSPIPVFRTGNR